MARKGVPKVRTGCLTCKKRKVKCDETRPACNRCTSTGRTCDGYMPPPPGCMSWDRLLSAPVPASPSPCPEADDLELRGLAFYQQIVAPALCGPLDSSFWTKLVAQMVHAEPATRHAVLAISWLYENFGDGGAEETPEGGRPGADDFAIQHYNAAISHLIGPQTSCPADLNTVLLVCILFTCIEFLRGDTESAISHSQHGISLLNSAADIRPELVRVFRHLAIFPYFFGGDVSTFPALQDQDAQPAAVGVDTLDGALESLDCLLARAVRLVRATDDHRLGLGAREQPPEAVVHEKRSLEGDLDAWWSALDELRRGGDHQVSEHHAPATLLVLEMRWLVCRIWASTCLALDETVYDDHGDAFARIVDVAARAEALAGASTRRGKFMFVMGFGPLLYFAVAKCRFLGLRLRALSLLGRLSCVRETLWDASTLYATGKRIVEIEHGIGELTPEQVDAGGVGMHQDVPPDEARVRDSAVEDGDGEGDTAKRRVCFLVLGREGIERMYDWV